MQPARFFLLLSFFSLVLCLPPGEAMAELPPAPDARARCPVCGMFVAPHPNWLAVIAFADDRFEYFDGPKDLFRYLLSPKSSDEGQGLDDIREVWVTEYYSARPVLANDVFFIGGSDVLGPMGEELVPIQGLERAEAFMRDHGGKKIFRFDGRELLEVQGQ